MSEYAPSIEESRAAYIAANMGYTKSESRYEALGALFDRMIAEVERAAAEKAWGEGVRDESWSREYGEIPDNPYAKPKEEHDD